MNFTNDQKREINHRINNAPDLKDHKGNGINQGKAKKGYYIAPDHRVIKLRDILVDEKGDSMNETLQLIADNNPDLKDHKGIGRDDATQMAKPGFFKTRKGEFLSIKQLREAEKADLEKAKEEEAKETQD